MRVLRHHADRRTQRSAGEVAHVAAVDAHRAASRVVETRHERGERRLAGTRRADDGDRLAWGNRERHVVQHVAVGVAGRGARCLERCDRHCGCGRIAEVHRIELHLTARVAQVDCAVAIRHGDRCIEHLEDAVETHERCEQFDAGVAERGERHVDASHECRQCNERARGDIARDHELGADAVHRHSTECADEAERHEEHPPVHRRQDSRVAHAGGTT